MRKYLSIIICFLSAAILAGLTRAAAVPQRLLNGECDGFVVDELLGLYYLDSGLGNDMFENSWCALQQKGDRMLAANYGIAFNRNLPTAVKGAQMGRPLSPQTASVLLEDIISRIMNALCIRSY